MRGVQLRPAVWVAHICINGERKYLGAFDNEEEANQARTAAELKYHHGLNYIRDRNNDIIQAHKEGASSKMIAYDFGLTYERIIQIIRGAK